MAPGQTADPIADRLVGLKPQRQAEARRLDALFQEVTGYSPVLWGRIIGYGRYRYTYQSGRSGEWFATGFSPLATKFSIHILPGYSHHGEIAARLGPHTRGKACWYVKRLADIDMDALRQLVRAGLDDLATHWPVEG
ncbi:MAG: DUF1801 domain-containing protein [Pseudomonadota bacterium]